MIRSIFKSVDQKEERKKIESTRERVQRLTTAIQERRPLPPRPSAPRPSSPENAFFTEKKHA